MSIETGNEARLRAALIEENVKLLEQNYESALAGSSNKGAGNQIHLIVNRKTGVISEVRSSSIRIPFDPEPEISDVLLLITDTRFSPHPEADQTLCVKEVRFSEFVPVSELAQDIVRGSITQFFAQQYH